MKHQDETNEKHFISYELVLEFKAQTPFILRDIERVLSPIIETIRDKALTILNKYRKYKKKRKLIKNDFKKLKIIIIWEQNNTGKEGLTKHFDGKLRQS